MFNFCPVYRQLHDRCCALTNLTIATVAKRYILYSYCGEVHIYIFMTMTTFCYTFIFKEKTENGNCALQYRLYFFYTISLTRKRLLWRNRNVFIHILLNVVVSSIELYYCKKIMNFYSGCNNNDDDDNNITYKELL